jgi:hypothetical protein
MNASAIAVTCFTDLQEDEKKKKKKEMEKEKGGGAKCAISIREAVKR